MRCDTASRCGRTSVATNVSRSWPTRVASRVNVSVSVSSRCAASPRSFSLDYSWSCGVDSIRIGTAPRYATEYSTPRHRPRHTAECAKLPSTSCRCLFPIPRYRVRQGTVYSTYSTPLSGGGSTSNRSDCCRILQSAFHTVRLNAVHSACVSELIIFGRIFFTLSA